MVEETWTWREFPVLSAIVEALEEHPEWSVLPKHIQLATGLTEEDVERALRNLSAVETPFFRTIGDDQRPSAMVITGVTERALVETGQWPSPESAVEQLIQELIAAAEHEPDPEKKTKLEQTAGVLGGIARQVLILWLGRSIPLP
jgi:hypothetical protein